jgi:pyrimidine-nucleoside phosphorylase
MDAEKIGSASVVLGAGRVNKEDSIDYTAGIVLEKKTHDKVEKGDVLCYLHTNKKESIHPAEKMITESIVISDDKGEERPLIYKVIK